MTELSLFEKTSSYDGVYMTLMVNRIQMLYFAIIMPVFLIYPYMIWMIIIVGGLSQVSIFMLSKWFTSKYASKGYEGFVDLFGERMVRLLSFIGIGFILLKVTVITLGYVEVVQHFIFPAVNTNWMILFILLICWYVASLGMNSTIRFIVIAFLFTAPMLLLLLKFPFQPFATIHDLFPLIPYEWTMKSWKSVLFIWSALSGPEYLVLLAPWFNTREKILKYMTIGNTFTVFEYLFIFIASLFFFGSHYLGENKLPVVEMIRYLNFPVFERIDIIFISVYLFHFVFAISIFLLLFYGAIRITLKKSKVQTTRLGFALCCSTIILCLMILNEMLWKKATNQNILLELAIWAGALTYLFVPLFLFLSLKRKVRD
ncbi:MULTISPECIES: GerAB/ArcD/ProY family transporter [Bacillaceae]|uniref:GerAB/ArcD/ProY family transporter n=2 Tax=Sutcliffiella horikoshii TaxID=79883 RepID=A0A5D4SG36_9BACI|nr:MULTISPECIES: GerAB/ArcD/ProY family transporter [Bacillaceae]TYS60756.1 GerAB/ArcD/ProY family transporter [Sutcliffiella horikoshii]TYS67341.1 GerAB/ArcD/ProY family transporter [Sutcliffiella horikoshii]